MLSGQYQVILLPRAARFIGRHPDSEARINAMRQYLSVNPYAGPRITHLKGRFHCRRRWREGDYRILYDIIENDQVVEIFDADNRGQIYR